MTLSRYIVLLLVHHVRQDLSVAGKRKGLAGERSGLFMEAVRIIREMREATNGVYPDFAIWENVPGAFSSNKGEDFRAVLEELARIREPGITIPRPKKKWEKSGYVSGDGWCIAWRLLDAKYWGVPQRRKRIALIMDFRGKCAGEILFERTGLQGNPESSIPAWKGSARDPKKSTGGHDSVFSIQGDIARGAHFGQNGVGAQEDVSYTLNTMDVHAVVYSADCRNAAVDPEINGTLQAKESGTSLNLNNVVMYASYQDKTGTLSPGAHPGSYNGQDAYNDMLITQRVYDSRGNGDGKTVPTITGDHENRVTDYTAVCVQNTGRGWWNESDVRATVRTPCGGDSTKANLVCEAVGTDLYNGNITGDCACSLTTATGCGCANSEPSLVSCLINDQGGDVINVENGDVSPTLRAESHNHEPVIIQRIIRWIVRRLTPTECGRLQGYPDGWCDIGEWFDSKGKRHKDTDTPKYKAFGNSIALPQWWWLVNKIKPYLPDDAKLGSLFDGIGGFPLVWEETYGKGTARWASEIEEFPIAVTKYHFPEEIENGQG